MNGLVDEFEMVSAARNRQTVLLDDGSHVVLVCWGGKRDRSVARVTFPNGRSRTVKKTQVVGLGHF